MGKWMELVSLYYKKLDIQVQHTWDTWEESLSPCVLDEAYPGPLVWAAEALGRKGRPYFPMLTKVWIRSDAYIDESLWLRPEEVLFLLDEWQRIDRLCRHQEYIDGLDGQRVAETWQGNYSADVSEWQNELNDIERLLERSIEGDYWIHIKL